MLYQLVTQLISEYKMIDLFKSLHIYQSSGENSKKWHHLMDQSEVCKAAERLYCFFTEIETKILGLQL